MIDIICDECGKKYRVDETKMKGQKARVKCKVCTNIMVITKPAPAVADESALAPDIPDEQPPPEPPMTRRA